MRVEPVGHSVRARGPRIEEALVLREIEKRGLQIRLGKRERDLAEICDPGDWQADRASLPIEHTADRAQAENVGCNALRW